MLSPEHRAKLDSIVLKMHNAGAKAEHISAVANDYISKFGAVLDAGFKGAANDIVSRTKAVGSIANTMISQGQNRFQEGTRAIGQAFSSPDTYLSEQNRSVPTPQGQSRGLVNRIQEGSLGAVRTLGGLGQIALTPYAAATGVVAPELQSAAQGYKAGYDMLPQGVRSSVESGARTLSSMIPQDVKRVTGDGILAISGAATIPKTIKTIKSLFPKDTSGSIQPLSELPKDIKAGSSQASGTGDTVTFYHGTTPENAEAIMKKGFNGNIPEYKIKGGYFADKTNALSFADGNEKGLVKIKINKNQLAKMSDVLKSAGEDPYAEFVPDNIDSIIKKFRKTNPNIIGIYDDYQGGPNAGIIFDKIPISKLH